MNISDHPIYRAIYELCLEIEKLPASEQETKVVTMAGALEVPVKMLIEENAQLKARVAELEKVLGEVGEALQHYYEAEWLAGIKSCLPDPILPSRAAATHEPLTYEPPPGF